MGRFGWSTFGLLGGVFVSLSFGNVHAANSVTDPRNLLAPIRQEFEAQRFSEVYREGDISQILYLNRGCEFTCEEGLGCLVLCRDQGPQSSLREVTRSTKDLATWCETGGDRVWVSSQQDPILREFQTVISLIALPGQLVVESVRPVGFEINFDSPSGMEKVPGYEVNASYHMESGSMSVSLVLSSRVPGIARTLRLSVGGTRLFRVVAFSRLDKPSQH
jgi:hypothetical protein